MPPKKPKATGRRDSRQNLSGAGDDGVIDASPDGKHTNGKGVQPRNILETRPVQDSMRGARAMWATYLAILKNSFANMERPKQEWFILRFSQAVTIGSAVLLAQLFYAFLPTFVRVFFLPTVILVSWFIGTRIVAPQMIVRFSKYLN